MAQTSLHYQDYRPLRKGELGYTPTARRYVSPSTGNIISVREFQQKAHGGQRYEQRVPQEQRQQRAERQQYTGADIARLSKQNPKTLTHYQQALVRQYSEKLTFQALHNRTGIDTAMLKKRSDSARIDETSVQFVRDRYVAYTPGGARKYLVGIQTRNGTRYQWTTERGAIAIVDQLDESDYTELAQAEVFYVA